MRLIVLNACLILIFLLLFNSNFKSISLFTAGAGYQDFYISSVHPNRSDSNPGTDPNYPWATFGHMINVWNQSGSPISAGDVIHLDKGSTFNISSEWIILRGGTSGHPITIRGDYYNSQSNSALAILKANSSFGAFFWIRSGNYITLRDFQINGNNKSVSSGVTIGGHNQPADITNIEVLNLKIYDLASSSNTYTSGIWLAASSTHSISNCLIQGNDISGYNAWGINSYPQKTTGGFQGFHYNNIFRNNYVHGFHEPRYGSLGGGIHIALGGSGNIYEYNIVEGGHFNSSIAVVNNSASETGLVIRYNVIKNNTGLADVSGSNKVGILFSRDGAGYPNGTIGADVYGNIITGNDHPAIVFDSSDVFPQGNVNIYNNTIYNNNKNLSGYSDWGGSRAGAEIVIHTYDNINIALKNNIIVPTKTSIAALKITSAYPATLTTSNNLYWNTNGTSQILVNRRGTTYTSSDITKFEPTAKSANPLFTNATLIPTSLSSTAGTNPDGLKPLDSSLAVGNAVNLGTAYLYDIDLKQRSGNWDIGAYKVGEDDDPPIDPPDDPPIINPTCETCTLRVFQNHSFSSQSQIFTVTWKATPFDSNMDGVMAFSFGTQNAYANFNVLTRFFINGKIEASSGNSLYLAESNLYYVPNTVYYFRAIINVSNNTYSLYVRPEGSTEQLIAQNYPFRVNLGTITQLNNYAITSGTGTFQICDFNISSVTQVCTSFTYSSWGACQPNNTQTRTVVTSSPLNCSGGNPVLTQSCTYIPTCTESHWTYSDGACQPSNTKTRTWSKITDCQNGVTKPATETVACTYTAPVCTSFTYSSWSVCNPNNTQTRSIVTSSPLNCEGGNPQLTQNCTYIPTCVESHWSYDDSDCNFEGLLVRNWTKTGVCQDGVTKPASEVVTCTYDAPDCIYDYSNWSDCSLLGEKTRTATQTNAPCNGAPQDLTAQCSPPCVASNFDYNLEPSVCPIDANQLKKYFKVGDCNGGITQPLDENISCDYNIALCEYTYSEYGACLSSGIKTRTIVLTTPGGCQENNPSLTQTCTYVPPNQGGGGSGGGSGNYYDSNQDSNSTNDSDSNNDSSTDTQIDCISDLGCNSDEKCENEICVLVTCEVGEIVENHKCVIDNFVDLNQYITQSNLYLIQQSNNSDAIYLLNQAKQSLIENNEIKAIAQINTALLKAKIAQSPDDFELQVVYEQVLRALNNEQYEQANDLALSALNGFSIDSQDLSNLYIVLIITLVYFGLIILLIMLRKKRIKSKAHPSTKEEIMHQLKNAVKNYKSSKTQKEILNIKKKIVAFLNKIKKILSFKQTKKK